MKTSWIPALAPTLLVAAGVTALVLWLGSGVWPVESGAETSRSLKSSLLSLGNQGRGPLTPRVPGLDVALVRSACLLHDLVRTKPKHAAMAQRLLENLGLCRLGGVVGAHMVMPVGLLESPAITEEELVYLADKLVVEDEIAGLEARTTRAMNRSGSDPAAKEWIDRRIRTAGTIRERVESVLGRPLDEVLPRQTRASI